MALAYDNPLIEGLLHGDGTARNLFLFVVGGVLCAEVIKLTTGKDRTRILPRATGDKGVIYAVLDIMIIMAAGPFLAVLLLIPTNSKECLVAGLSWIAVAQSAARGDVQH